MGWPADPNDLFVDVEGEPVRLESDWGGLTLNVRISEVVPGTMVRVDGMPRPADCTEGYGVNVLTGPEVSDLGEGATFFSTRVDLVAVPSRFA